MGGMKMQSREIFVVVSYDFEYVTEEGKEVWMKEGEVLLLLNRTNHDWWQVIRRGDRRPFYAPARYVMELKENRIPQNGPPVGDWDSAFSSDQAVHYRSDNGEPLPVRLDQINPKFGAGGGHFSTFLGGAPMVGPNPSNKRSSYSPSTQHGSSQAASTSDFLFGCPRFQERYRSNSMDSILVADMSRQQAASLHRPPHLPPHQAVIYHHQVPAPPPNHNSLEKRPTFDNIDKRSSWSTDKGANSNMADKVASHFVEKGPAHFIDQGPAHFIDQGPAHFATSGLMQTAQAGPGYPAHYMPNTLPHHQPTALHKKPVPLPRSKIPVPTMVPSGGPRSPFKQELRTFKRSKTDLSQNMLSNYKAGRAMAVGLPSNNPPRLDKVGYQGARVDSRGTSSAASPVARQQRSAQVRSRPSNRANRPAVINEESLQQIRNGKQESQQMKNPIESFQLNRGEKDSTQHTETRNGQSHSISGLKIESQINRNGKEFSQQLKSPKNETLNLKSSKEKSPSVKIEKVRVSEKSITQSQSTQKSPIREKQESGKVEDGSAVIIEKSKSVSNKNNQPALENNRKDSAGSLVKPIIKEKPSGVSAKSAGQLFDNKHSGGNSNNRLPGGNSNNQQSDIQQENKNYKIGGDIFIQQSESSQQENKNYKIGGESNNQQSDSTQQGIKNHNLVGKSNNQQSDSEQMIKNHNLVGKSDNQQSDSEQIIKNYNLVGKSNNQQSDSRLEVAKNHRLRDESDNLPSYSQEGNKNHNLVGKSDNQQSDSEQGTINHKRNHQQIDSQNKINKLGGTVRSECDFVPKLQEEILKDAEAQTEDEEEDLKISLKVEAVEVTENSKNIANVQTKEEIYLDNKPKLSEPKKRSSVEKRKSSMEKRKCLEEKRKTTEERRRDLEENRKSFEELIKKSSGHINQNEEVDTITAEVNRSLEENQKLYEKIQSDQDNKINDNRRTGVEDNRKILEDRIRSSQESLSKAESKENLVPGDTNIPIVNSSYKRIITNKSFTNEKFLEMEDDADLPEPPPTPPQIRPSSSPIEIVSAPLVISTEPMSVSSCSNKPSEDQSGCSTSFDSLDGSLDSAVGGDWPDGGDWLGSEPTRDLGGSSGVKSPASGSTCSRSPPSPTPGMTPTRRVFTDWDEFLDSPTGRKFYFNSRTGEKSWKPPRRSATGPGRGGAEGSSAPSEGFSVPTSPDPFSGEHSFDLGTPEKRIFGVESNVSSVCELESLNCSALERIGDCRVGEKLQSESLNNTLDKQRKFSDNLNTKIISLESVRSRNSLEEVIKESDLPKMVEEAKNETEASQSAVPSGYEVRRETEGETFFVNMFTGVAWYSATDQAGRVYYYEENGNESCWSLPNVARTIQDHSVNPSPVPDKSKEASLTESSYKNDSSTDVLKEVVEVIEQTKTDSLRNKFYHHTSTSSLQIGDVNIVVVKQGPLNKTRITENGKKYRKNWAISNIVLTDTFLLFFKDAKAFQDSVNTGKVCKPDQCVDLKGSSVEWCNSDKSKRSNVFQLSTQLELRLLMQDDDFTLANDWFCRIDNVIVSLSQRDLMDGDTSTLKGANKGSKVSRTKSLKLKLLTGQEAQEAAKRDPLSPDSPQGAAMPPVKEKSRIREKLRKFFLRRPAVEDLMKRGILKNEPVFGTTLQLLAKSDNSSVPLFVKKAISIIESRVEYLSTDGVYRQSGNLSVVQRLRLQIDQGNLGVLDNVDDIHVLTGALKLFFRELKEPLIPWEQVDKLLSAINQPGKKGKVRGLREVLSKLPPANQDTLVALLKHLEKVTSYKDVNRMAVSNLAIVFGPTLMWPPAHLTAGTNMALNMMQQNMIVEALISNLNLIT